MYTVLLSAGNIVFRLISLLIVVNVVFSWIRPNPSNPIVKFIYSITEPIIEPFRRINIGGPVDFSPLFAYMFLSYVVANLYAIILGFIFK